MQQRKAQEAQLLTLYPRMREQVGTRFQDPASSLFSVVKAERDADAAKQAAVERETRRQAEAKSDAQRRADEAKAQAALAEAAKVASEMSKIMEEEERAEHLRREQEKKSYDSDADTDDGDDDERQRALDAEREAAAAAKADRDAEAALDRESPLETLLANLQKEGKDKWEDEDWVSKKALFLSSFFASDVDWFRDSNGWRWLSLSEWVRTQHKTEPKLTDGKLVPDDIRQGELGDCFMLSALSTLTQRQELFWRMLISTDVSPAGVYGFRFQRNGEWVTILIDDKVPFAMSSSTPGGPRSLKPVFANSENPTEMWPVLAEKAYAKLYGSYQAIEGGYVDSALVDMTGGVAERWDWAENEVTKEQIRDGSLWVKLLKYAQAGYLLGAGSTMGDDDSEANASDLGIVQSHAYSVLRVEQVDGLQLLMLRNPWGRKGWRGAWGNKSPMWDEPGGRRLKQKLDYEDKDDGKFWMTWQDFTVNFSEMNICKVFASSEWTERSVHKDAWSTQVQELQFAFTPLAAAGSATASAIASATGTGSKGSKASGPDKSGSGSRTTTASGADTAGAGKSSNVGSAGEGIRVVLSLEQADVRGDTFLMQDSFPAITLSVYDNTGLPINTPKSKFGRLIGRTVSQDRQASVELTLPPLPAPGLSTLPDEVREKAEARMRAKEQADSAAPESTSASKGKKDKKPQGKGGKDGKASAPTSSSSSSAAAAAAASSSASNEQTLPGGLVLSDCFDPWSSLRPYTVVASVALHEGWPGTNFQLRWFCSGLCRVESFDVLSARMRGEDPKDVASRRQARLASVAAAMAKAKKKALNDGEDEDEEEKEEEKEKPALKPATKPAPAPAPTPKPAPAPALAPTSSSTDGMSALEAREKRRQEAAAAAAAAASAAASAAAAAPAPKPAPVPATPASEKSAGGALSALEAREERRRAAAAAATAPAAVPAPEPAKTKPAPSPAAAAPTAAKAAVSPLEAREERRRTAAAAAAAAEASSAPAPEKVSPVAAPADSSAPAPAAAAAEATEAPAMSALEAREARRRQAAASTAEAPAAATNVTPALAAKMREQERAEKAQEAKAAGSVSGPNPAPAAAEVDATEKKRAALEARAQRRRGGDAVEAAATSDEPTPSKLPPLQATPAPAEPAPAVDPVKAAMEARARRRQQQQQ